MWRQLTATVADSAAEAVAELLDRLGALSVSLEDAGDQPLFEPKPGETPLWSSTHVTGLFDDSVDTAIVRLAVEQHFTGQLSAWREDELADQVWERAWLEHFKPMAFGKRLWICPSGFEPPSPDGIIVSLDPGLAFGTGNHATTALCLEWLDGEDLADRSILDYGCGSGILAVAALKLGAQRAYGLDIDPQALTASAENARKNDVADRLELLLADAKPPPPTDLVIANILAQPLIELAPRIVSAVRSGGRLALSGILASQLDSVRDAYRADIVLDPPRFREDWALISGTRRP